MSKYPEECAVFEMVDDWCGNWLPTGTIVEGIGFASGGPDGPIELRAVDPGVTEFYVEGFPWRPHLDRFRPLTRTAREWLAAAKASK